MTLSTILVNADDFGYSNDVNRAIVSSLQSDLITSTSLMVNMPGFEDALAMVRLYPELEGRIGLHLNLTEGFPLTTTLHSFSEFCDPGTGRFVYKRAQPLFRVSKALEQALYEELKAQTEKAINAGIRLTHIDSHHHVHTEWAMAPIVCRLAREYEIKRIRLTRNIGRQGSSLKSIYKTLFNQWQLGRQRSLKNTDYFGDIEDFRSFPGRGIGKRTEIMVHPLFNEKGVLIDLDRQDLRERLEPIFKHDFIRRVSPNDL
ncbi:MAG: ChbG/HpnK family deacetylase [Bacteroidetes bacterium]|nr:ChbG/HpnK family deacetylase [Bacteroidota bacterium]